MKGLRRLVHRLTGYGRNFNGKEEEMEREVDPMAMGTTSDLLLRSSETEGGIVITFDDSWLASKRPKKLASVKNGSSERANCCICRVPRTLVEARLIAFQPQHVSIGPYHHDQPQLKDMEVYKWLFLESFLQRSGTSINDCLDQVQKLAPRARASYADLGFPTYIDHDQREFVLMLLLDGCFIIQLMLKVVEEKYVSDRESRGEDKYDNDPKIPIRTILFSVQDLFKLENQLPLCIIECLIGIFGKNDDRFENLIFKFVEYFAYDITSSPMKRSSEPCVLEGNHLLDLFFKKLFYFRPADTHKSFLVLVVEKMLSLPGRSMHILRDILVVLLLRLISKRKTMPHRTSGEFVPFATKLKQVAGIKFKPKKGPSSIIDFYFINGALEIPSVNLSDRIVTLLLNFVAMEQCFPCQKHHFSAYILLMDMLINTERDVALLSEEGIIFNYLRTDDDLAHVFNTLGKVIDVKDRHLFRELAKLDQYYRNNWMRLRAGFMRNYLNTPWLVISTTAALVLLFLTLVQTIFGILSYFKSSP